VTNIWEVLLQGLSVTMAAAMLLLVKNLLADKLSPRWQYGIWAVLALRILVPAGVSRSVILPFPLWVETWKAAAEQSIEGAAAAGKGLASVYSSVYDPIGPSHVLPWFTGKPASLTDWLLVLYAAGILLFLLWHFAGYIRLRLLLRKGSVVDEAAAKVILDTCEKYDLEPCQTVFVPGLPSAFVCGVVRPVLALPAGEIPDEKVLLHELLHLKHRDVLQNLCWTLLRALHWWNPLLHLVFDRIGNDMESLCDQRVLERLEGEERREYGTILLSMASERYARAAGTSSISNGGKNISRRIAAIVRFKKYPKGMSLVAVCIAILLSTPLVLGSAIPYAEDTFRPANLTELDGSMAMARLNRCTTVAGAFDTYAKGLVLQNGIYLAVASPLDTHADLAAEMRWTNQHQNTIPYHLESGEGLDFVVSWKGYQLFDLVETADGGYEAWIVVATQGFVDEDGFARVRDENGNELFDCCVIIPVKAFRDRDGSWVVEETGDRILSEKWYNQAEFQGSDVPYRRQLTKTGASGTVSVSVRTTYTVENYSSTNNAVVWFGSSSSFNTTPQPNAKFERIHYSYQTAYSIAGETLPGEPKVSAGYKMIPLKTADQKFSFPEDDVMYGDISGSHSGGELDGYKYVNSTLAHGKFNVLDGEIMSGSGSTWYEPDKLIYDLPEAFAVQVFWDGSAVETLVLSEEDAR